MAKLQLTISDDLGEQLNTLKKFEKSAFCELAIKNALKNPDITSRFIWKSNNHKTNKNKPDETIHQPLTSKIEIDEEFK